MEAREVLLLLVVLPPRPRVHFVENLGNPLKGLVQGYYDAWQEPLLVRGPCYDATTWKSLQVRHYCQRGPDLTQTKPGLAHNNDVDQSKAGLLSTCMLN